jgi:hypothetical protein
VTGCINPLIWQEMQKIMNKIIPHILKWSIIVSILIALITLVSLKFEYQKLANADVAILCCDDCLNSEMLSIKENKDSLSVFFYKQYTANKVKTIKFKFETLRNGSPVYILDIDRKNQLAFVLFKSGNITARNLNEKTWVDIKYLCK